MKNIVKFALLFFFSVLTISCPEKIHRYLYIKNNSSESIYYRFSFAYPDTSLMNSDPNNYKIIPELKSRLNTSFFLNSSERRFMTRLF